MGNRVMTWDIDVTAGSMVVTVKGTSETLSFNCNDIDAGFAGLVETGKEAFVLGVKQHVANSAVDVGTPLDKRNAMAETVDLAIGGNWRKPKKVAVRSRDLVAALVIVAKIDETEASKRVAEAGKEVWARWEKNEAVAAVLAEIESKRSAEKVKVAKAAAKDAPAFTFDV